MKYILRNQISTYNLPNIKINQIGMTPCLTKNMGESSVEKTSTKKVVLLLGFEFVVKNSTITIPNRNKLDPKHLPLGHDRKI